MDTLNFNFNQCVKSINNIGSTTYQNICNNASQTVQWGTFDWILLALAVVVTAVIVLGLAKLWVCRLLHFQQIFHLVIFH